MFYYTEINKAQNNHWFLAGPYCHFKMLSDYPENITRPTYPTFRESHITLVFFEYKGNTSNHYVLLHAKLHGITHAHTIRDKYIFNINTHITGYNR